jgi:hypothetical protein
MIAAFALVAIWAFAEAILFVIVADVPISYVALRFGWRRGVMASIIAALAAALGGVALLLWASADLTAVADRIAALPAVDMEMLVDAHEAFGDKGYAAMFAGSFSGIPYKLYAFAAAPEPPGGLALFFLASVLVRLPRFLCVALLVAGLGKLLEKRTGIKGRLAILGASWMAFYAWYFATMPA